VHKQVIPTGLLEFASALFVCDEGVSKGPKSNSSKFKKLSSFTTPDSITAVSFLTAASAVGVDPLEPRRAAAGGVAVAAAAGVGLKVRKDSRSESASNTYGFKSIIANL